MSAAVVLHLRPAPVPPGGRAPSAAHQRAQQPALPTTWALAALAATLPWRWPAPAPPAASPKPRYRSQYQHPGSARLHDAAQRAALSDFEIALHLIDFTPLEPVLAAKYRPSRKGQVPFHPVSLFLACALRRERGLSWRGLARLLAGEHGAGWRALCGFQAGATPSASGLRYFAHTLQLTIADIVVEAHNVHHPVSPALYYRDQQPEALRAAEAFRAQRMPKYLGWFERVLENGGGPWLLGPAWTYPDLSLFQLMEGLAYAFPTRMATLAPTIPRIAALRERVRDLPELADYLHSERRLPFNEDGLFRHYPELDGE